MLALYILVPTLLIGWGLTALFDGDDDDAPVREDDNPGETQIGAPEADTLTGGTGDDFIDGRAGEDSLSGLGGDDELAGGNGDDTLRGGVGTDTMRGGNGEDLMFGGRGADDMRGGAGTDELYGDAGDDALSGENGEDGLYGDLGADVLIGGADDDVLYGADILTPAAFRAAESTGGVAAEESFEEFIDPSADTGEADTLDAGAGDDLVIAGSNDAVSLGDGLDNIVLGPWVTAGAPITVSDFDPDEDALIFAHTSPAPPDDVRFELNSDGDFALVSDAGTLATLTGTAGRMVTADELIFVQISSTPPAA